MKSTLFGLWAIPLLALGIAAGTETRAAGNHAGGHDVEKKPVAAAAETEIDEQVTPVARLNGPGTTKLSDRLVIPKMDAVRGKKLFVDKGCVACHAVNGVGGEDAPPLDAHTMNAVMNPFDFVAKMWRAAGPMIAVQEEAMGEQILFSGDELADIVAFVHDDETQHTFTLADLTPEARRMMDHSHDDGGHETKLPAGKADDEGTHGHPPQTEAH